MPVLAGRTEIMKTESTYSLIPLCNRHWLRLLASGCGPAPSTPPAAPPPPPQSSDPRSKIPHGVAPAVDRAEASVDLKEIGTYYQLHQADGTAARAGVLKDIQHDHSQAL